MISNLVLQWKILLSLFNSCYLLVTSSHYGTFAYQVEIVYTSVNQMLLFCFHCWALAKFSHLLTWLEYYQIFIFSRNFSIYLASIERYEPFPKMIQVLIIWILLYYELPFLINQAFPQWFAFLWFNYSSKNQCRSSMILQLMTCLAHLASSKCNW